MRICHVVEAASGGAANVVISLSRFGIAAGDDITVVHGPGRVSSQFEAAARSVVSLKTFVTPLRREVGPHDVTDAWRLYRLLRREGPFDVIHGHSSKAGALVRVLGPLFPRSIKVYTPHAFVTLDPNAAKIYRQLERGLSWFSDAIVTVSRGERDHAIHDLGIDPRKVVLIANGVNTRPATDRAEARRLMDYDENAFVVGFIGRFAAQKNLARALSAFSMTASTLPGLRLALISPDALPADLAAGLAEEGVADRIRVFNGYAGTQLVSGLDCLLCTSDYEGFPLTFVEALMAGVPIITTPVGGAAEAVIEGQTGFVVADFSPQSLSDALRTLNSLSEGVRAQIAEAARLHGQRFDVSTMGEATRLFYSRLLK